MSYLETNSLMALESEFCIDFLRYSRECFFVTSQFKLTEISLHTDDGQITSTYLYK